MLGGDVIEVAKPGRCKRHDHGFASGSGFARFAYRNPDSSPPVDFRRPPPHIMTLFLLSALLHAFIGWRLLPDLIAGSGAGPVAGVLGVAALGASALLVPMGLMARWLASRGRLSTAQAQRLAQAGLLALGAFSSLFVATVVRDAALMSLGLGAHLWPTLQVQPGFLTASAAAAVAFAAIATAWGYWNARQTAAHKLVEVPIAGLPPGLHGFRIAQITDIHVGPTIQRAYLQAIVERVNALDADLVAVTGDLVDGSVADLGVHVQALTGLRSRHGTYFVTGNHEYYSGAAAWVTELRRLGVHVLMNEHRVLDHGGEQLVLAGVTDVSAHHFDPSHRSDPLAAMRGAPADAGVRVLLAHQPRSAAGAAEAGFDLQLSGHTHGGQFWPWIHFVRLQQPFTAGLHRLKDLWVYTSRGTGYWGPPKRFGAPSEITCLRLVRA